MILIRLFFMVNLALTSIEQTYLNKQGKEGLFPPTRYKNNSLFKQMEGNSNHNYYKYTYR